MSKKIGVIIGSLRKESLNRKMANTLIKLAPPSLSCQIIEIGDLPLYNQDLDDNNDIPPAWVNFREKIKSCDGILFVTPEYNRSIPGVLKNCIDIGSRPYGKSVWTDKPAAVISVSPGAIGGFGANQHLRQTFVFLDIHAMQQPEAYIGSAGDLFTENGEIAKSETQKFLEKFINSFAEWMSRMTKL